MSGEHSFASSLGHTVREREFEVLGEQLLHVWAFNIVRFLDLDDFEDLFRCRADLSVC